MTFELLAQNIESIQTALQLQAWQVPADKLFYRLPLSHLTAISKIDDPLKRNTSLLPIRAGWLFLLGSCRRLANAAPSFVYYVGI